MFWYEKIFHLYFETIDFIKLKKYKTLTALCTLLRSHTSKKSTNVFFYESKAFMKNKLVFLFMKKQDLNIEYDNYDWLNKDKYR